MGFADGCRRAESAHEGIAAAVPWITVTSWNGGALARPGPGETFRDELVTYWYQNFYPVFRLYCQKGREWQTGRFVPIILFFLTRTKDEWSTA